MWLIVSCFPELPIDSLRAVCNVVYPINALWGTSCRGNVGDTWHRSFSSLIICFTFLFSLSESCSSPCDLRVHLGISCHLSVFMRRCVWWSTLMVSVAGCGSMFYDGCGTFPFSLLCMYSIHLAAPPVATPTLPLGIAHSKLCNYLYLIWGMDLGILFAQS